MTKYKYNDLKNIENYKNYTEFSKENIESYRDYLLAKVDNELISLNEKIRLGSDVEFLDYKSVWGYRALTKTLSVIFTKAFYNLFPKEKAELDHYLGSGLYIDFQNDFMLSLADIDSIRSEMERIINADMKIETYEVSRREAEEIFSQKDLELVRLINTYEEDFPIGIVKIGNFIDINHSVLAPSTGFIKSFRLIQYYPGLLLVAPTHRNDYNVNNYVEMPKFAKTFQQSTEVAKMLELNKLYSINEAVLRGDIEDTIKVSEALFDKKLMNIADEISSDENIKLILISGPTSSGKTTFTNRLRIQLKANGINPISISMDDYFVNREDSPIGEDGEYDFETPYALDLELFNDDMNRLFNMEMIYRRKFDFISGTGSYSTEEIIPGKNTPIMVEGIHALNPIISHLIPDKNKYKIYISAMNQLNLDAHNRISTTDTRFIRRAVRDKRTRGYEIDHTFKLWENVKKSEELYLFPFQENADVILDTSLAYEMGVLKKYIVPMLETINVESEFYFEAQKLIKMLKSFVTIEDDSYVNSESLLREFIGR